MKLSYYLPEILGAIVGLGVCMAVVGLPQAKPDPKKALREIRSVAHYGSPLTIEEMGERLNAIENTAQKALEP